MGKPILHNYTGSTERNERSTVLVAKKDE